MVYVRSRKFCCCLPVRFGVFCESLLGMAVGGLFAVGGWLTVHDMLKGTINPPLSGSEKTAVWVLSVVSTLILLISLGGLIGAIGKLFSLVSLYAGAITLATVVEIASGIYVIYQLFHGEGASDVSKCEQNAGDGVNEQFTHFACSSSFKVGRAIVVVIYVLFWLFIIYGCHIAFEYVGQLKEEREGGSEYEKQNQSQNVTIVAGGGYPAPTNQYPFAAAPNAGGRQY
ncbi:hypothetical protein C8Q70DRAFT_933823 [Cubamyces menziesii]|uniref:Uncharacterized protein n=1 Tax=Trametes cubensis TaxID=1111947 RepID=A0AAD7TVX3_9APHY|nr:hypothetical protein C8Q70DRAFT_933823 [Cubamyces menziesii]KAJ8487103.1 hypothetical protein ONZ51_g4394 [Trametes cubensis]